VLEQALVDARQPLEVGYPHALVDLVDGRVDRPDLDDLRAERREEAAVRGAAAREQHRRERGFVAHRRERGLHEPAVAGEVGLAAVPPAGLVLRQVAVEHGGHARAQAVGGARGRVAEIEHGLGGAGDHVVGAGASAQVRDLERGRREVRISRIPLDRHQLGQHRRQPVDRVVGLQRVGDVALLAVHRQVTAE
jgi:hypothetical protein